MNTLRASPVHAFIIACAIALAFPASLAFAQLGTGKLLAKRITTGLSRPVWVTTPPGDNGRLFIVEKIFDLFHVDDNPTGTDTGRIRIYDKSTQTLLATSFLEIPGVNRGNEEGLLGLAFHPNYATNGHFYVYFSDTIGGRISRVVRYTANAPFATSNTANAASALEVMRFSQPQGNHNGGWIGFNPVAADNAMTTGNPKYYLYISTGDGGGGDDNDSGHTAGIGNGQDTTNLLGKILRVDTGSDGNADAFGGALQNYAIPPDNPLVGDGGGVREEIWSYGLRNPWRCCFDRQTGDFWIGDVGQNAREEVDFQPAAEFVTPPAAPPNYGWRLREGDIATPTPTASPVGGPAPAGHVPPVIDYPAGIPPAGADETEPTGNGGEFRGDSVTGGCVYRGSMKWLQGAYFFGDFISNRFWSLRYNGVTATDKIQWGIFFGNLEVDPAGTPFNNFASFSEGNDGEIYVCTQPQNGASETAGTVFLLTQKPFFRYRSTHFTLAELNDDNISGVNADNDNDNMTVGQEFVFNTDPTMGDAPLTEATLEPDLSGAPVPEGAGPGDLFLTLTLEISPEAKEAVTYTGESGAILTDFDSINAITLFNPPTSTTLKTQDTVPIDPGNPPGDRRFLRIDGLVPDAELTP